MEGKTNQERFELLLKQLNITDDVKDKYFHNGTIERLIVHQKEKKWHFHFALDTPLPYHIYQWLQGALDKTFQAIATTTFTVRYEQLMLNQELVLGYWPIVLQQLNGQAPGLIPRLQEQSPEVEGTTVTLTFQSQTEKAVFHRKLESTLQELFAKLGLSGIQFQSSVKTDHEALKTFKEKTEEESQSKAMKALEEQKARIENQQQEADVPQGPLKYGYDIKDDPIQIKDILEEERRVTVQGYVFECETRELRSGRTLLLFKITDYSDSILVKLFLRDKEDVRRIAGLKEGLWVKVRGGVQNDTFVRDLVMLGKDIEEIKVSQRTDDASVGNKRIELHAHTVMSQMDAVVSAKDLVQRAADWGHEAVAITDHGVVQSYPEAFSAAQKHGIKVLYGLEANVVDDGVPIAYNEQKRRLSEDTYVVYDVETTGLSAVNHKIIELAGVKVKDGEIIERFESFANPHEPLSQTTTELTGITDDMVSDAPEIDVVLQRFHEFTDDAILVAHNAQFDMGFLNVGYERIGYDKATNPVIDTLELGRMLYPDMKNHRLNTLCKVFNIDLTQHHRAIYDAEATGYLLWKMLTDAQEKGIYFHDEFNKHMGQGNFHRVRPSHVTVLAKNQEGLKNLYQLVSLSHVEYFHRVPRIPRSQLEKNREGLIIGSGCEKGEVFEAALQKTPEEVEDLAKFYDYLEIQPLELLQHLIEKGLVDDEMALRRAVSTIVNVGEKLTIPVAATGNVHYLDPHEHLYRKILVASQAGNPLNRQTQPKVHFRNTEEMLKAFSFLGEEKAKETVITNTKKIADEIEELAPVPDKLYTPVIEGADDEVRNMCFDEARRRYGDELPEIVEQRLEKELDSIIGHGFAVIYLISAKLVKKSLVDGYLVGSRGSVGSSFAATMMDITEVNPLPPHYTCPECQHAEFFNDGSVACGFDLPEKECSECGAAYTKDGHDIPFETFLGFKGDKVPDIDLNFSGEYQPVAHNYTKELFGEEKVFRAGTIGTVADKTAFGFVKGYEGDHDLHYRGAEIDRLASGCTGVKRTTGQHPGGIIVVPDYMDIYDCTPIQFPADDKKSEWKTTHFDFHSIHDNLLKLDILGHDDPTVIRMLQDLSGMDPKSIPTDDPDVMAIFSSPENLGVNKEQIRCSTGALGIPEFGTRFVRQMLEDTRPTTFAELVQISGLSHGTDVWLGNAQDLINRGICELKDVISCRDDIMVYLMHKGLEPALAFKITEFVRKGRGLQEDWIKAMKDHEVPDWYIDSCLKIKYMFPKAHATAYVLMAVRIAYFKVHHPILFYSTYFTVRADDFDIEVMRQGAGKIRDKIDDIEAKGHDASPKEKSLLTVLEIALEMCERGMSFKSVDLYQSSATDFLVDGDSLLPPFNSLPGVGTNAALNIVRAREAGEFLSKEDLQKRAKLSRTVVDYLDHHGCLEGLPDANQLSLF